MPILLTALGWDRFQTTLRAEWRDQRSATLGVEPFLQTEFWSTTVLVLA